MLKNPKAYQFRKTSFSVVKSLTGNLPIPLPERDSWMLLNLGIVRIQQSGLICEVSVI